jgi:uncharacterized protein GlcG (DUF336 family)
MPNTCREAIGRSRRLATLFCGIALLVSCGGGGGNFETSPAAPALVTSPCSGCAAHADNLTAEDVQTILAQAVGEALAHHAPATLAVTDRLGNVLAVYQMQGAQATFTISDGRAVSGGLENVSTLPSTFAAIAEALTGAYLSSNGNAFSTRTAGQIIQENFDPGTLNAPGGPLFGVQFSQLPCSDLLTGSGTVGPRVSPLGLSASPGGLPLYKGGVLVGGIGAIADGLYTIDRNLNDIVPSLNELIAVAGATGYAAPASIRADRITANGIALRYVNSEAILSSPAQHAPFDASGLLAVPVFNPSGAVQTGAVFGTAGSGIRPDDSNLADLGAYVLVDGSNNPRFPAAAGTDGLITQGEALTILRNAIAVANHTRAQIRQPLNSTAQVSIFVVDTHGVPIGFGRTMDAPVFGIDVALQKARTALFFSGPQAAGLLLAEPAADYLEPPAHSSIAAYVTATQTFLGNPAAFADGTAYSARAIGNLARPFFPDGINGNPPGPLSKSFANWSVFSDGLELDLAYNDIVAAALAVLSGSNLPRACTGVPQLKNGIQIFPGGVPIYRGSTLVGAIGVSGDGVDQDDMVAFLGLANAGVALGTGIANAPAALRADTITPPGTGTSLLYVQCPQAPFVDTDQQGVCNGL